MFAEHEPGTYPGYVVTIGPTRIKNDNGPTEKKYKDRFPKIRRANEVTMVVVLVDLKVPVHAPRYLVPTVHEGERAIVRSRGVASRVQVHVSGW